jgi:hypothetical protein
LGRGILAITNMIPLRILVTIRMILEKKIEKKMRLRER